MIKGKRASRINGELKRKARLTNGIIREGTFSNHQARAGQRLS